MPIRSRRKNYINTNLLRGGHSRSDNATFEREVNERLYGDNTRRSSGAREGVALATSRRVPENIAREVNARGGRNSLRLSPNGNGNMTEHEARYKELRAAFGMSMG